MTSSSRSPSWRDGNDTNSTNLGFDSPSSRLAAAPSAMTTFFDSAASRIRDLTYASAFADGAERMHSAADLFALYPLIAAEAVTIISADAAALVRFTGIRRQLVDSFLNPSAELSASGGIRAMVDDGWLQTPGYVDDLAVQDRMTHARGQFSAPRQGSLMIVALDIPTRHEQIRLIWFSSIPHAFADQVDVAELFGRHVTLAIRTISELDQAISARHRIGQAQGILMGRYSLTADDAVAILQQQAQDTNTTLLTIADNVVRRGRVSLVAEHCED